MIKQKHIKRVFGVLLGGFFIVGCTDLETQFTDSIPVETTDGGTISGNPAELLEANYAQLSLHNAQDNVHALLEHSSDELIGPTRGTDWGDNGIWRSLHQHTWDPTHNWVRTSWNSLNSAIYLSNQVLASSPTPQQAAEAKFLMAYNMSFIVDVWGQVPFRNIGEGVDVDPTVMSRAEAFQFMVEKLEEAIPNLPEGGPTADPGQASKAAAWSLLARLYLNKAVWTSEDPAGPYSFDAADMNKVIEYADKVTALGYDLEEEYFDNFRNVPTSEKIFVADVEITSVPEAFYYMGAHYNQTPGGWNGFTTLSDFYNKFDKEDVRLGEPNYGNGFAIGPQVNTKGEPVMNRAGTQLTFVPEVDMVGNDDQAGIRVFKYHPESFGPHVLIRYSDVYLMKIEAILRGGAPTGGQTAQGMLDRLRELRGIDPIEASLEVILDERGRELYWERVRRTDQIRFGTFLDAWEEKPESDPARLLFPIPQQAIDSNPNLEQNPGY